MVLKNKQERLNYFNDSNNWFSLVYVLAGNLKVKKLKNYPIMKIYWDLKVTNYDVMERMIGCYRVNPDWTLENCYSMSINQCIDLMTKCDNEVK